MRYPDPLFALVIPALLFGCGSSPAGTDPNKIPPSTATSKAAPLAGSWTFAADASSATLPNSVAAFNGTLQTSAGKVTGAFRAVTQPSTQPCVDPFAELPATGTLDPSGTLTLRISIAGGSAVISATLPADLRTRTSGQWQISGGACATDVTPIHLVELAQAANH